MLMPRPGRERRFLRSKAALLLGAGVLVLLLIAFSREILRRAALSEEIRSLEEQEQELEERQSELTALVDYFSSPLFQEQEARRKLGLARPGEEVVIVPLDEEGGTAPEANAGESGGESSLSNPMKWWRYFFPG